MKNGLPVINADASVQLFMPPEVKSITEHFVFPLHDKGLGYPDITSKDGVYSAYVPVNIFKPGYYSLKLMVTNVEGQTKIPITTEDLSGELLTCIVETI